MNIFNNLLNLLNNKINQKETENKFNMEIKDINEKIHNDDKSENKFDIEKIKNENYLEIDNISDEKAFYIVDKGNINEYLKKLKLKYQNNIGAVKNNWKVVDISVFKYEKYLIGCFDCECINCKKKIRINIEQFIENIRVCECELIMTKEWEKLKDLNIYNKDEYIKEKIQNFEKKIFLKNPNINFCKDNILFGSVDDIEKYYNELNKEETDSINNKQLKKCKCCGKSFSDLNKICVCPNCEMPIRMQKNTEENKKYIYNCNFLRKNECDDIFKRKINLSEINISIFINNEYINFYKLVESFDKIYQIINGKIERLGISNIKEITSEYSIVDFKVFNSNLKKYINLENVYYGLNYPKDFEGNPKIFYYKKDKTENVSKYSRSFTDYIFEEDELEEFKVMYLSKEDNEISLKIYNSMTDKINEFKDVCKIIRWLNYENVIIENLNGRYAIFNILDCKKFDIEFDKIDELINFQDTFTDIIINPNDDRINTELRKILNELLTKNYLYTEYKKVYFQKDLTQGNLVLNKYLNDLNVIEEMENEFDDDKTENYIARIRWEEKEKIDFIEYIDWKESSFGDKSKMSFKIYGINIEEISRILLNDIELRVKICNLMRKNEIFIINDKNKRESIIYRILMNYIIYDEENIINKIIERLCNKYNTDTFGLVLILIAKYGEECVFGFEKVSNRYFKKEGSGFSVNILLDEDQNLEKYNNILSTVDIEKIRWKSEFMLFKLISSYFKDAIYQYRFKELGLQSLDIFIPKLNIAFEYQGEQHYKPINIFGGKEHFERQKKNDMIKRKICEDNNIILIEWKYDEPINKINLDKKLEGYKNKLKNKYKFSNL